uniref:Uncharacterized protein n=1 Tax=Rhizophora mucronata TaxID=61149 RepID=A0A2P2IP55_RHIMU
MRKVEICVEILSSSTVTVMNCECSSLFFPFLSIFCSYFPQFLPQFSNSSQFISFYLL